MRDNTQLAKRVGESLLARGWRIACAESCTGGLLSETLTRIHGSSQWFDSCVVTYSNQAKIDLLGVTEAMLNAHGAVSEEVARAMAKGCRKKRGVDVAVSITGIAGPDGGTKDKPVGCVCLAWALPSHTHAKTHLFVGTRMEIREQSVAFALTHLIEMLREDY